MSYSKKYMVYLLSIFYFWAGMCIAQDKAFEIISQNNDELVIKYIPQKYDMNPIEINGQTYLIPSGKTSGLTNETGKPGLPVEATLIAFPPNNRLTAEIIESKFELVEGMNIAPIPEEKYDEDGNAEIIYNFNYSFYNTEISFYPSKIVKIDQPAMFRNQVVSKLTLHPMQYQPVTKTVKLFTHLTIRIRFINEPNEKKEWEYIKVSDKHFEMMYNSLILNYAQSKNWRVREKKIDIEKTSDPTTAWWTTSQQYYRIPIVQDGMYRLTFSHLLSAGINMQTIPLHSISLYYKGQSVPVVIDTSDANAQNWYIDFYGNRKYGDSTFFDIYSDTSYYFLTWNDSRPKRFTIPQPDATSPTYHVSSYTAFRHFERDSNYYYGYNDDERRTVDNAPGEGWYWLDFTGTTVKTITFYIDTINSGRFDSAFFKARFHGMAAYTPPDTNKSRHQVRVTLNGKILGEVLWTQNQELIFKTSFIDTLLKKGNNTLQINSYMVKLSKFYLDWFQLTYNCPLSVENNYLDFTSASQPTSDVSAFRIAKVNAGGIVVFDLTNARKITNINQEAPIWVFKDTSRTSKRYIVTATNQRLIPLYIASHTFKNIRSNLSGADYIVITHSLFKSAATTLANNRASIGLRTTVVDVQDIYDEFNYGHLEPLTIKQFLKYTFSNWALPAPSYIVMFGDACLDFKKKFPTTTKTNFVPGYGIPMSDNQLVCFDSAMFFIPAMNIGRIPVENPIQGGRVVTKIINYNTPPMDNWNKRTLFIAGGQTDSERWQFNTLSNMLINESITPFPLGGEAFKVYKNSPAVIDGAQKLYMQGLVNEGISFINFIGHSGGRIWNVDIGNPTEFQNTTGKLPFVSSVSCNIGAFYTQFANVLSEDFLMADNRGGIGAWASSDIGSAQTGYWLTKKFLANAVSGAAKESLKTLGELTTSSRIYFWVINGSIVTPTIIHTLNLYPLIGDPYTKLAIPVKPDFVMSPNQIKYFPENPIADNIISLSINVKNFGLMSADSILISVRDNYTDELGINKGETDIVPPFYIKSIAYSDTINIDWDVRGKAGSHILKVNIDPLNSIIESNETNNYAELYVYVYQNVIYPLKPKPFAVVQSGSQVLRVTVPIVFDSLSTPYTGLGDSLLYDKIQTTNPLSFYFELDTVVTFNSPFRIQSLSVTPTPVYAEWTTPNLLNESAFFWRARSFSGGKYGAWTTNSFIVSDSAFSQTTTKWKQIKNQQFSLGEKKGISLTDSGVTMKTTNGLNIFARSLGARAYPDSDYYSIIRIGSVTVTGLWWENAWSYLVARIDPQTGNFEAKSYTLPTVGQPDSMLKFLQTTPVGYYVAIVVVRDGRSSITEALYQEIQKLSNTTVIRSVTSGQSWSLISRKGTTVPMMTPLESYSLTDVAIVQFQMPNYYSAGAGELISPPIGRVSSWSSLYWDNQTPPNTNLSLKLSGIKKDYTIDTLLTIQSTDKIIDISNINGSIYPRIQLNAFLSNTDGFLTPTLKNWTIVYSSPMELATSPLAFNAPSRVKVNVPFNVDITVFNIGHEIADSVSVIFSLQNGIFLDSVIIDSIPVESSQTIINSLTVSGVTGNQVLVTRIQPKFGMNDYLEENNVLFFPLYIDSSTTFVNEIEITFDGKVVRHGDYVSSQPLIEISFPKNFMIDELTSIMLDNVEILIEPILGTKLKSNSTGKYVFEHKPKFSDGDHRLIIFGKNNITLGNIEFKVSNSPQIFDVYNYPNPFSAKTFFTFKYAGSNLPHKTLISIYTVAGRKIRDINVSSNSVGFNFNSIEWDGLDSDGNEIANGIYLYKIKISTEEEISSSVQKLVKLR